MYGVYNMNSQQTKCTIVMYHYIRNMNETNYPNLKGRLIKEFIGQLDYIQKKYTIISIDEYLDFLSKDGTIPKNSCVLSFDDGLKDHYLNVFPILQKRKLSACFYPITQPLVEMVVPIVQKIHILLAMMGSERFSKEINLQLNILFPEIFKIYQIDNTVKKERKYRWDDTLTSNLKYNLAIMPSQYKTKIINNIFFRKFDNENKICSEFYMNWDEIKEMSENNMRFGGHTHNHPMLSHLNYEEQLKEITESKKILEKNLKMKIKTFSYPYGNFNDSTIKILKQNGFLCGITTDTGINIGRHINKFELLRLDTNDLPINIQEDMYVKPKK